jgi:cytochrome P450
MFQPQYTMNGLEVKNDMTANGSVHSRALRVLLRSKLSSLEKPVAKHIALCFENELAKAETNPNGWFALKTYDMAKRLSAATNCLVFFGAELTGDHEFLDAALAYPEHLMQTAEILRLLPSFVAPFISPLLMHNHKASNILVQRLTPVVQQRIEHWESGYTQCNKNSDCIQYFVEASGRERTRWTPEKVVQALLGVWFAAVHQPAISLVYALDDLCRHTELVETLRTKILENSLEGKSIDEVPLLDAFLKESARLNPSDSISVRRKVLEPFTFTDGTCLEQGDVACLPLRAILQDGKIYENPLTFDPYRFISTAERTATPARFIDSTSQFPLWGLGKRSW